MRERPILFSAPMVRAIIRGHKTQTRRIINLNAYNVHPADCAYGQRGDRLWVRETFAFASHNYAVPVYRADFNEREGTPYRWKPSIYMPRAVSRITLEIIKIGVERLQSISENDARAEGTPDFRTPENDLAMKDCFRSLWESINGKGSWRKNPWVWVVRFKRIDSTHT